MLIWAWKPTRHPATSPPRAVVTTTRAGSATATRSSKPSLRFTPCAYPACRGLCARNGGAEHERPSTPYVYPRPLRVAARQQHPARRLVMADRLAGMQIAFLTANEGVEQIELTDPWQAVEAEGGRPVLVAPEPGTVQAFHHRERADRFPVDMTVAEADPKQFAGLVLPGGVVNSDRLRTNPGAVHFTRACFESGKPVAAICHAPWALI